MSKPDAIVFVVDDELSHRESLQNFLESIGLSVRTFASAEDFLVNSSPDVPGCLLLDIWLPGMNGLDLQRELAERGIRLPIVFLTAYRDVGASVQAMKAGAVEFLIKPFRFGALAETVRQAIEGDRAAHQERAKMRDVRRKFDSLTLRERQVMELVVTGLLNKQIAAELGTSEITVKVHRSRLMRKLEAGSLPDLVRMVQKLGIPAHLKALS
jgi:FixJ family two-component response regulator